MSPIIFLSVACPAVQNFPTLFHKGHDFRGKKVIEHKMWVSIFSTTLSESFFIVRKIHRDMIINVYRSSYKTPFALVRF